MRLDLNFASVETIYVTIWASPNISLHLGKVENADEIWKNHVGIRLQVYTFISFSLVFNVHLMLIGDCFSLCWLH